MSPSANLIRRLIVTALSGGLALGLLQWSERPGHGLPNWLLLLPALPLLWINSYDDHDWHRRSALGRAAGRFGLSYLLAASTSLTLLGFVGLAFPGSGWAAILVSGLPPGAVAVILVLVGLWRESRSLVRAQG